jgi:uncharacterized protein (TIGR02722 family)
MNKHTTKLIALSLATTATLAFTGCNTTGATYVDPNSTDTVVSLNQINIQDWNQAADELVSDLLASGALESPTSEPAIMAISRIKNDTQVMVNTESLTKKIQIALNNTGRVVTTTTLGYGGKAADPMAAEAAQMEAFMTGKAVETKLPDYTLSGTLLQDVVKAGSTNQVSYIFQLSLTSVKDGIAIWEGEKIITKKGSKPAVSW